MFWFTTSVLESNVNSYSLQQIKGVHEILYLF